MTKREVIKWVLDGKKPPYVPWSFKFTEEPKKELSFAERMKAMKEGTLEEQEKAPEPAPAPKPAGS